MKKTKKAEVKVIKSKYGCRVTVSRDNKVLFDDLVISIDLSDANIKICTLDKEIIYIPKVEYENSVS